MRVRGPDFRTTFSGCSLGAAKEDLRGPVNRPRYTKVSTRVGGPLAAFDGQSILPHAADRWVLLPYLVQGRAHARLADLVVNGSAT